MPEELLSAVIETDYGQFDIIWSEEGGFDGDSDRFFSGQVNGLVGAADRHGLYLGLARRSGGSHVRIVLAESAPSHDSAWEDVVEVSTLIPDGAAASWTTWGSEVMGDLPGLAPGAYRVRVSARGRDAGAMDEFADQVVDYYLVEFWPAPHSDDEILRTTSENAAYWHSTWGQRRPTRDGPPGPERQARAASPDQPTSDSGADPITSAKAYAACKAIGADVDGVPGHRVLSGRRTTVVVHAVLQGQQKRLFKMLAALFGWWGAFSPAEVVVGDTFWLRRNERTPEHAILGTDGCIGCTYQHIDAPRAVTMTWNWHRPGSRLNGGPPFLDPPSALTITLTGLEEARTAVGVEHAQVPTEWAEDLETFWHHMLIEAERVYRLNYRH